MKKLYLCLIGILISLTSVASATDNSNESYKPLVVEGRTWWYHNRHDYGYQVDYGVRIGEQVEIDGVNWNKVEMVLMRNGSVKDTSAPWNVEFKYESEPMLTAYIREENGKVYSIMTDDCDFIPNIGCAASPLWIDTFDSSALIYNFGKVGDSFDIGTEERHQTLWIESVKDVEINGNAYRCYMAADDPQDKYSWICPGDTYNYLEEYGVIDAINNLFWIPMSNYCASNPSSGNAFLRYVTEGSDNNIVFTADGGTKLWEEFEAYKSYKPLVVEGRTWWYHNRHDYGYQVDYGVRIGDKVDIDGVGWNKVEMILMRNGVYTGDHNDPWRGEYTYLSEPMLTAYIREENGKVYSIMTDDCDFIPHIGCAASPLWIDTFDSSALIYNFGKVGDSFDFGTEEWHQTLWIEAVEDVEINGSPYRCFVATGDPQGTLSWIDPGRTYDYLEEYGVIDAINNLFWIPVSNYCAFNPSSGSADLRYVTEGPDNNIVFTADGGTKLWEEFSGVEDVSMDNADAPARWYDLTGIEVAKPTVPGVYIRVCGGKSEKIMIK